MVFSPRSVGRRCPLELKHFHTISALGWNADGATIYCTTYVAPSHVIVWDITTEAKTNVISNKVLSIDDLKLIGIYRFVVANIALIIADTETEIDWHSGGNEKYYFDFPNVCLLINAGEITVVEYGIHGPLGWLRTELTNPQLLRLIINKLLYIWT